MTVQGLASFLARRPFNQKLKVLAHFKAGESFVKVQGNKNDVYGKLFAARKAYERGKNEAGDYADQAAASVDSVGKGTTAFKRYAEGKLPDARIHLRSRRWAVKMFLSHVHNVFYHDYFGTDPPVPFVFAKAGTSHIHLIPPPNLPAPAGASLRSFYEKGGGADET